MCCDLYKRDQKVLSFLIKARILLINGTNVSKIKRRGRHLNQKLISQPGWHLRIRQSYATPHPQKEKQGANHIKRLTNYIMKPKPGKTPSCIITISRKPTKKDEVSIVASTTSIKEAFA